MEKRVLIVAVLAALLCLASFAPRVAEAAIARPTKEQLKAELGKLAESVAKKRPRYSNFTSTVNNFFGLAMNSKYDLSALDNATILIPINTDSEALFEKLPFKRSNFPKFYQIAAFHILRIKRYMPQLKVLKPGEAVAPLMDLPLAAPILQEPFHPSPMETDLILRPCAFDAEVVTTLACLTPPIPVISPTYHHGR
ncbi:unnamed protein product [Closterium sp. NIES-64]|nr:unnamed protein product [Closterium sp. NIES-64]CAI5964525.1 unnamed protein product [Closterium sp. NIES-65]